MSDIFLKFKNIDFISQRLEVSSGVAKLENTPEWINKDAYFPINDWKKESSEKLKFLLNDTITEPSQLIGVITIPTRILNILNLNKVNSFEEIAKINLLGKFKTEFVPELKLFLTKFLLTKQSFTITEIGANPPNLVTTAYDGKQLVGLHIDSWDKSNGLSERKNSKNRICINLGNQDRFLLFISYSVEKIIKKLSPIIHPTTLLNYSHKDLYNAFLSQFPKTPVYRLKIKSGEAYIAPTENIIHDGSSLYQDNLDLYITAFGMFSVPSI